MRTTELIIIFIILILIIFASIIMNQEEMFHLQYKIEVKLEKTEAELFKDKLNIKQILERTHNCYNSEYLIALGDTIYKKTHGINPYGIVDYIKSAKNYAEENITKLAISFVVHNNPGLFEILFHLLFRPYNDYCIVIDKKVDLETKDSFDSIIRCYKEIFPDANIIIANWTKPIYWGGYSVLDADLTCLELLYNSSSNWQYYINLAGTQFPLYNLDDFAAKLKAKNVLYSIYSGIPPKPVHRWEFRWTNYWDETKADYTKNLLPPVPYNLTMFKGPREVVLSRNYSRFCLEHPVAKSFRNWIKHTKIPDESYFQTLSRISDIVSHNNDSTEVFDVTQNVDKYFDTSHGICLRYTKWCQPWLHLCNGVKTSCFGEVIRSICHLALEDYNQIINETTCFVANKFNIDVDVRPILNITRTLSPIKDFV